MVLNNILEKFKDLYGRLNIIIKRVKDIKRPSSWPIVFPVNKFPISLSSRSVLGEKKEMIFGK